MNRTRCNKTEEAIGVKACVLEGARDAPGQRVSDPGTWRTGSVAQEGVGRPGDVVVDAVVGAHEPGEKERDALDEGDALVAPREERGNPILDRREERERATGVRVGRRRDRRDWCDEPWP